MSRDIARREEYSEREEPTCPHCRIRMEPAILTVHFPRDHIPGRGYRCLKCGYEALSAGEADRLSDLAKKLGLYEPAMPMVRKITRSGKRLSLYIPKDIEETLNLKKGMKVKISVQGDRIVIEP